jgi:serine/threonine protein kinase
MRDIFRGLDYLHKSGLIHTDIKPENILMNKKVADISGVGGAKSDDDNIDLESVKLSIGDLGSSTTESDIFSYSVGTTEYIAPEIILEFPKYTSAIDIWSAFALCYELITGDVLFDVYQRDGVYYGDDIETNIIVEHDNKMECDRSECDVSDANANDCNANDCDVDNSKHNHSDNHSEHTDEESSSEDEDYEKTNYYHLLLIAKVLDLPPKEFAEQGREYYNARGKLKKNPDILSCSVADLLKSNYYMEDAECDEVEKFLMTGLKYNAEDRCTAAEALAHPWLAE